MKVFLLSGLMLIFSMAASAQGDSTPRPGATPNPLYPGSETEDAVRRADDLNRRSDALRMTQNLPPEVPDSKKKEFRELIEPLYRDSSKEEREVMAPAEADRNSYSTYADKKDSGIIRLIADRGCADNAKVVDASADCARYTMPGAGSGYSFRFGDYRMHHISDIVFRKGNFEALGVLNHGIMVDLGDLPIDSVDENTAGVEYLKKIKPSKDFQQAGDLANKLTKGIENSGHRYASILPVRENSTYVIRSIAYDGEVIRKVGPFTYNELELDRRRDVIVVFRVVRLNGGNDATIVWKVIDDSKAPKLKPGK